MLQVIRRIPLVMSQVFVAMVIGHVALIYVFFKHADQARMLQKGAKQVKEWIITYLSPTAYNHFVDLLLEERTLLFMFFTVLARLALAIVWEATVGLWSLARR